MQKTTKSFFSKTFIAIAVLFSIIASQHIYAESSSGKITKIEVTGNTRTENSTILSYIDLKAGSEYNQKKADNSIKSLYATGFFSKINIDFNSGKLKISVIENPIINKVDFQGNKSLKTEVLSAELSIKTRSFFSKSKLNNDVNRLIDIYNKSGRFSTKIVPQIAQLPQNRINVLFKVEEGKKSTIKKIIFVNNTKFSDNKLKSEIMSKEDRIYNIFRVNYYDEDILEYDKVLLSKFYHSQGYADFKVISATADIVPGSHGFYLTFSLEEGDRYNFGDVSIKNYIPEVKDKDIRNLISFKKGKVFNANFVENSTQEIIKYLAINGYPFVDVKANYDIDKTNKVINVNYSIEKAQKVYIGKINIHGNLKTYDTVIRKEIKLAEGDPYNSFLITNSEQRLKNLDFFEKVKVDTVKTSKKDVVDLDVTIEEKSTASVNLSAGYSTSDGPLGMLGFTEKNLLGQGKKLSINLQKSAATTAAGISLTQPNFLDSTIDAGFSLDHSKHNNNTSKYGATSNSLPFTSKHSSASVFMNYDITDHLSHSANYSISKDSIGDIKGEAASIIREQTGKNIVSSVGHTLAYDKTDSSVNPKRGYVLSLTQVLAGLGGDSKYIKNVANVSYYYPLMDDLILKLSSSVGNIKGLGKKIRINENFTLGGYSLRGFEQAGIGPRDKASGNSLGGTNFYTGTVETKFPVPGLPKDSDVSLSIFSDFGAIWGVDIPGGSAYTKNQFHNDKNLRASVGVGLIWVTSMGPLRIDIAKPIKKQQYDETRALLFSFSTLF